MKKKVVHLITSLKMGGAESLLCDFLAFADRENYDVAVIYFHEGPNVARLRQLNIPLFHIKGAFCLYDPVFFFRLYACIKTVRPSLLHTWLWSANIAGRIMGKVFGIPILNSFHNNVDQDGMLRGMLDRYSQWMATALVAVSDGVASSLVEHHKIPFANITTIKNGIPAQSIQERGMLCAKARVQLGLEEHHFVIGSVGRFVPLKNYSLLLEAFAHLQKEIEHARLVLLGSGPEEQKLRALALALGIADKVVFVIGQQSYGYYPLFDCFVLSSYKEGISMALLEAMSFSLPCVSTHEKITHDVIKQGINGLLVPSGDKNVLKEAMKSLIWDEQKADLLGKNAYKTVKNDLSLEAMKNGYEAVYLKNIKFFDKIY